MRIGFVAADWIPPEANACTGPVCAEIGTPTISSTVLGAVTATIASSALEALPLKTMFVTPSRFWPVIFTADPPWMRLFGPQFFTHATAATRGCAVYVMPPLAA
jgi:hypothetical protein